MHVGAAAQQVKSATPACNHCARAQVRLAGKKLLYHCHALRAPATLTIMFLLRHLVNGAIASVLQIPGVAIRGLPETSTLVASIRVKNNAFSMLLLMCCAW